MAGRIPQDFIDDLIERADITEVIGSRMQLKKAGREYKAPCPFHSEKTPSFTVSPQKGFYHCFGCGAHGTALGFLMEFDRLEFVDAVEELAQLLGLEVPRDQQTEQRTPLAPIYEILERAGQFYQQALKKHADAVEYLKTRGLDGETARAFGIGYAPGGWDFLLRQFDPTDEVLRQLNSAGLIVPRDGGGYYDRFRERIVFPIRDSRGRVVGFGGRVIGAGEPKYLNSPETATFHKGSELYGLFEARKAQRKLDRILVVEGYMDVVSLAANGIDNVVGTLGTATTPEHLRRLFRATQEVAFCFDGDRAGRQAAWRALQTSLPEMREGRQVRFLFLPDGDDPDSLVRREGPEGLAGHLQKALPLSDYLLRELETQADVDTMDGRARLAELARPLLDQLPAGVYRELLTDRLAERVGIGQNRLAALLTGDGQQKRSPPPGPPATSRRRTVVRQAIQLVLNFPSISAEVVPPPEIESIQERGVPLLLTLLGIAAEKPDISPAGLVEKFRDRSEGPHLQSLLTEEMLVGESAAIKELADCLIRIVSDAKQRRLEELATKANDSGLTTPEKEELRTLRRQN